MIGYVTLGTNRYDETAGFFFRGLYGNRRNAFCMHGQGS